MFTSAGSFAASAAANPAGNSTTARSRLSAIRSRQSSGASTTTNPSRAASFARTSGESAPPSTPTTGGTSRAVFVT